MKRMAVFFFSSTARPCIHSPASSGEKRERNYYQGHLATENIKHLSFFHQSEKLFISHIYFHYPNKYFKMEKGTVKIYIEYLFPSLSVNGCAFNL